MTSLDLPARDAAPARRATSDMPFAFIVGIGLVAAFALSWPHVVALWASGTYADTDDAMRMVQVRDWLAGQGWYDLVIHRLDPPGGAPMHWSRVVDIPLALLIRGFGLFAAPETADRLARLAFPLSMQVLLIVGVGLCGRVMAGAFGTMVAVALAVGSGFMFGQFVPGRIDHHAPQIVLLVFMVWAMLRGLAPAQPRYAALAGLFASLTLAIALENLPFVLVLAAIFPAAYAAQGAALRPAMMGFGLAFAGSLVICFGLFIPPALWFAPVCDALSIVHVEAALAGAAAMAVLAGFDRWRRPTLLVRLVATALAGVFAVLPLLLHRQCLIDPFTGIDPLVREVWLANVTEARTIPMFMRVQPGAWPMLILPWALGTLAIGFAALTGTGLARVRFAALFVLCLAGSATAFYMVRSTASVAPIALLGGVWACGRARRLAEGRSGPITASATILICAPFTTFAWALAPDAGNPGEAERLRNAALCKAADAFPSLAALPPALVFAPIDSGPHLLVHTPHRVLGAPYHRNNRGNRAVLDAFLAPPEQAEALVRETGARYVALCPGQTQVVTMSTRAPLGLAARLVAGEVPGWLHPVVLPNTPFQVYEVAPPS